MTITTQVVTKEIMVNEDNIVFYLQETQILENDVIVGTTNQRFSLEPGSSLASAPEQVVIICNAIWTPSVVSAYKQLKA